MKRNFIPTRVKMVAGTFILAMIVLFDRILISVVKDPIASDLSLSDKQMGWVLSIFANGYALFQTPSGYLADKLGARKVLTAVVSLCSIFTALTGAVYIQNGGTTSLNLENTNSEFNIRWYNPGSGGDLIAGWRPH